MIENRSKDIFYTLIARFVTKKNLRECMKNTYMKMLFIQKKIQLRNVERQGKIEVLINYWDKIVTKLTYKATELKDKAGKLLLQDIMLVPK